MRFKRENFQKHTFNELIQNSKVNNVQNVIIIQKAITKSSVGQHGPPINAKVGSDAAKE
jgi:hypothetical protein